MLSDVAPYPSMTVPRRALFRICLAPVAVCFSRSVKVATRRSTKTKDEMPPDPTNRRGSRKATKSRGARGVRDDTRAKIMRAAREVLATVGYAHLTMRLVAREAGLAVGNLVYHYPSKRSLIHALILSLTEYYRTKSSTFLRKSGSGTRDGLPGLIRYYMRDSVDTETSRLFRELWAMALHDSAIAAAMDRFYREAHRTAVELVRLSHPGLVRRRAHDIVQLMGTMSEGANVIFATARGSEASRKRVARLAGEMLEQAAQGLERRPNSKN